MSKPTYKTKREVSIPVKEGHTVELHWCVSTKTLRLSVASQKEFATADIDRAQVYQIQHALDQFVKDAKETPDEDRS